jgi:hypothetical protein
MDRIKIDFEQDRLMGESATGIRVPPGRRVDGRADGVLANGSVASRWRSCRERPASGCTAEPVAVIGRRQQGDG